MMICVGTKFKSLHVVGSKCSVKFGFAENICWFLAIFDKIDKSAYNFFFQIFCQCQFYAVFEDHVKTSHNCMFFKVLYKNL